MAVIETNTRTVNFKVVVFYFFLIFDLIFSTFIELNTKQTLSGSFDSTSVFVVFA